MFEMDDASGSSPYALASPFIRHTITSVGNSAICTLRRRRKKRIRRIFDDAELAEETKSSMAQEKARQEHLKSMQESANKWTSMISSTSPPASMLLSTISYGL